MLFKFTVALVLVFCSKGHSLRTTRPNGNNVVSMSMINNLKSSLKSKFLPAVLGTALLIANPQDSLALSSGSRSGGSSFRSSPSRSYGSSSSRAYSSRTYVAPSVMPIMPMYSPFGYGGFGFSPFGFIPINLNVLLLAGCAYAVYAVLSNRMGGSDFSINNGQEYGTLGSGASVLKLSIALDADWNARGNIMDTLSNLSERNSAMTDRRDLSRLLSEASLALLRQQDSWSASSFDSKTFSEGNARQVEPTYQQLTIKERSKFEQEVKPSTPGMLLNLDSPISARGLDQPKPTQAVVSLIVAFRGKSNACSLRSVRTISEVRSCLEAIAGDAISDDGENIMGVEVMWTPSERSMSLSERDLIVDYPELVRL